MAGSDFLANLPDPIEKEVRNFLARKGRLSAKTIQYLSRFAGANAWMLNEEELARIAVRSWVDGWTAERTTAAVQQSGWYQSRTEQQRAWAQLTPVDQRRLVEQKAIELASYWQQISGERVDPSQFMEDAKAVASGQTPDARWRWDQQQKALAIPESPYAREIRSEEEAQLERGVSIENLTGQLELRARQEFLTPIDRAAAQGWAQQIISNQASEQDFIDFMRERSASKFPQHKEKILAGGLPSQLFGDYLQMAREEFEKPTLTFDDTLVASGIQQGMALADYQAYLRRQPGWRGTRRAQQMGSDFTVQLLEQFGKVSA